MQPFKFWFHLSFFWGINCQGDFISSGFSCLLGHFNLFLWGMNPLNHHHQLPVPRDAPSLSASAGHTRRRSPQSPLLESSCLREPWLGIDCSGLFGFLGGTFYRRKRKKTTNDPNVCFFVMFLNFLLDVTGWSFWSFRIKRVGLMFWSCCFWTFAQAYPPRYFRVPTTLSMGKCFGYRKG